MKYVLARNRHAFDDWRRECGLSNRDVKYIGRVEDILGIWIRREDLIRLQGWSRNENYTPQFHTLLNHYTQFEKPMSYVKIHETPQPPRQVPLTGTNFNEGECFFLGENANQLFVRVLHGAIEIPIDKEGNWRAALYRDEYLRNRHDCYPAPYRVEIHVYPV